MHTPSKSFPVLALCIPALWALSGACSDPLPAGPDAPLVRRSPRSQDPRARILRDAIEEGRVASARQLLTELGRAELGVEHDLLSARLASLEGQALESARLIEAARAAAPNDARVYATAAELAAFAGRSSVAAEELVRGAAAAGATAELLRAQAVQLLYSTAAASQAPAGLAKLQQALEVDPDLPFVRWPLSEAHRLVGQQLMATQAEVAEDHLRLALEIDADNREARELLGELCVTQSRYKEGLAHFEMLLADGQTGLREKVANYAKLAGTAYLLVGERDTAVTYFLRARALGLPPEALTGAPGLAFEAELLERVAEAEAAFEEGDAVRAEALLVEADEYLPQHPAPARLRGRMQSRREVDAGVQLLGTQDYTGAAECFQRATELDPESLEARNFLAAARFSEGDYEAAAHAWHWVVDTARLEHLDVPDPVHLQLARALVLGDKPSEAREVLQDYLLSQPAGKWSSETRTLLAQLPGDAGDGDR